MASKKVWCRNCGQTWRALREPISPDCLFCPEKGSVELVVPDKLTKTLEKARVEAEGKAASRAREHHEREAHARRAGEDEAIILAARRNPADAEVRALLGKAEDEDDAMEPAAPPVTPTTTAPPGLGKVRPLGRPPPASIDAHATITPQPAPATSPATATPTQLTEAPPPPPTLLNPTQLVTDALKEGRMGDKAKGIMEWLSSNPQLVQFFKETAIQLTGAIDRHGKRNADIRREELALQREMMERGLMPGGGQQAVLIQAPAAAAALPDFQSLPLDERIKWAKNGGMAAYYRQAAGPAPASTAAPPAANPARQATVPPPTRQAPQPTQPRQPARTDAGGNATDLTTKGGVEGLREARRNLGLPEEVGAPGSFSGDDEADASPLHPAESEPDPLSPAPPTDYVPGEEDLPAEMRALPRGEKEAIVMANNIVKTEHADRIAKGISQVPPEDLRELVDNDRLLINEKLGDVLYLLPQEQREHPAVKGLLDVAVRDLVTFMPESTRSLYAALRPEAMAQFVADSHPDKPHLNDAATQTWLIRNFTAIRDSMV